HSGTTLAAENTLQMVPFGLAEAMSGNVRLVSADDVVTDPSAQILATTSSGDTHPGNGGNPGVPANVTGNIDILGNQHPGVADPYAGDGTVMVLRGTISPGTGCLTRR